MKWLLVVMLVAVVGALGSAGIFMLRKRGDGDRRERDMARALAVRVGLSIALFAIVMLAWALGWIEPSGLPVGR
jgi:hypothetical protein